MEAEVRKMKCTRSTFSRNLWKNEDCTWFPGFLWHGYKSLWLWGASKPPETHLEGIAAFRVHLPRAPAVALLYKHTHITFLTKSLQKQLPAFVTRQKIFPLKLANSSLVHLSPAELLSFSSHFRLIFSFPKEQNILFPDLPEGSVFATSNRTYKPSLPLQKPIILSTGFLTATRGESLYTDSRALLLLENIHDFFKLLLHFISLKNS